MKSVLSAIPSNDGEFRGGSTHMIRFSLLAASLTLTALPFTRAESTASNLPAPAANHSAGALRGSSGRAPSVLVAAIDSDRNGVLSAAEIAQAPVVLAALDTNGDGVLSSQELRRGTRSHAVSQDARPSARPMQANFVPAGFNLAFTLDANHDGEIQMMEIANAVSSLKTLDLNGDGELTADELQPAANVPTLI